MACIERTHSTKPFLKWAGGKTQLLPEIKFALAAADKEGPSGRYFEPFMGSAAVFFGLGASLQARQVVLSDTNIELVLTFRAVRDYLDKLLEKLSEYEVIHNTTLLNDEQARRKHYEAVRALDRQPSWLEGLESAEQIISHAARMIYLNKTCFNGLWRVNSRGFYNVPMGRYPKPTICQEDVLRKASEALQGVCIKHASYLEIIRAAASGDLVYFDPPYMPVSPTASFNAYAKEGFSAEDHQELALVFLFLALQGVFVLLSNSDTPFTRLPFGAKDDFRAFSKCVQAVYARQPFQDVALKDLFTAYQERWQVQTVRATRAINSRASARGAITELLISSHVCV